MIAALAALLLAGPAPLGDAPARPLVASDFRVELLVPRASSDVEGDLQEMKLDLRRPGDLARLRGAAEALLALGERQHAFEEQHPERFRPFAHDVSSAGKRRALRDTIALADEVAARPSDAAWLHLLELVHAVQNSFRYPVERDHQLVPEIVPGLLLQMRHHQSVPVVGGDAAPAASSVWHDRGDVAAMDLGVGFDRDAVPALEQPCTYDGPKTGWGAHPGFDVACGGRKLRFNLGDERYGAVFNTRVFHALGYEVAPVDAAPALRLRYDRRVLKEYNARRTLEMRARLGFVTLFRHVITDVEDPFDRIVAAVLTDGSRLDGRELKARLLPHAPPPVKKGPRPETLDASYDPAFEARIAELVWEPGTVEDGDGLKQIGAFDYDQLDHAARPEIRALFVLAAWLDQFNLRWENTRLAYRGDRLVHLMSDVGSGLGSARDLRHDHNSDVEAMAWEVTERRGDRVRFSGFAPNVPNRAFSALAAGDARWMLRRIAAIREAQIADALAATSMSEAEQRLALEKLVAKRRRMLGDFGLLDEFPELAARRADTTLDFDPGRGPYRVRAGHLEKRP